MSKLVASNQVENVSKLSIQEQKVPDIDSCYDSSCLFFEINSR